MSRGPNRCQGCNRIGSSLCEACALLISERRTGRFEQPRYSPPDIEERIARHRERAETKQPLFGRRT